VSLRQRVLSAAAHLLLIGTASVAAPAGAEPAIPLDRVSVRFSAPELGGARSPRFIYERVLAFEARIEALADPDRSNYDQQPYRQRHVRAALERHLAEELLSSFGVEPPPTADELRRQTDAAHAMLVQRVGGADRLRAAASAEGIDRRELLGILRRQARASLYLDRMVAPMLLPSDAELRNVHRSVPNPFAQAPFEQIAGGLRRWVVGRRLSEALSSFYENARGRLRITVLHPAS